MAVEGLGTPADGPVGPEVPFDFELLLFPSELSPSVPLEDFDLEPVEPPVSVEAP